MKWDIGDLHPLEERSILFQAFIKSDLEGVKNKQISKLKLTTVPKEIFRLRIPLMRQSENIRMRLV